MTGKTLVTGTKVIWHHPHGETSAVVIGQGRKEGTVIIKLTSAVAVGGRNTWTVATDGPWLEVVSTPHVTR